MIHPWTEELAGANMEQWHNDIAHFQHHFERGDDDIFVMVPVVVCRADWDDGILYGCTILIMRITVLAVVVLSILRGRNE